MVERAGRTLMMMPASGCRPAQIKSCWPDAPDDYWLAYGSNDPAPVRMRPTMAQMNELNVVMDWLPAMTDIEYRRVVSYRMLNFPDTEKPVYSWVRLGKKLGCDRREAKRRYADGLQHLADCLNRARR